MIDCLLAVMAMMGVGLFVFALLTILSPIDDETIETLSSNSERPAQTERDK